MSQRPTSFPSTAPQPVKGGPDTAGADEGNHYREVVRQIERDLDFEEWDTCLPWPLELLAHVLGVGLALAVLMAAMWVVLWVAR
jgi:hypothetical protein